MRIYVIMMQNTVTKKLVAKTSTKCFTARQAWGILKYQFDFTKGQTVARDTGEVCDYYGRFGNPPQLQPLTYVVCPVEVDADDINVPSLDKLPSEWEVKRDCAPTGRFQQGGWDLDDLPF